MEDWLKSAKDNRRGDILCIYVLSMVTGRHTCIHLRNKKLWCTLHAVPVEHGELLDRCELHLAYLRFGIFLRSQRQPPIEIQSLPTLGVITSDNPDILKQLTLIRIKKDEASTSGLVPKQDPPTTSASMVTHADMSIKVERTPSSSTDFPTLLDKPSTSSHTSEVVSKKPHVNKIPFRVELTRLTQMQIEKFTSRLSTNDYTGMTSAHSDIGPARAHCVTGMTRAQQRVKKN